jgi:DNA recombination protein RmuC
MIMVFFISAMVMLLFFFALYQQFTRAHRTIKDELLMLKEKLQQIMMHRGDTHQMLEKQQEKQHEHHVKSLTLIQNSLRDNMKEVREQLKTSLSQHAGLLSQQVQQLSKYVNHQLKDISGQVDKRLTESFKKTDATFSNVVERLAIIDEAQKKIADLSNNVVSLQEVLSDKRSRGAFGEMQLQDLIRNMLPEAHFSFQHTLNNGKRVDCMLFLPPPTGHISIDAKFPLDSYRKLVSSKYTDFEKKKFNQQFKKDVEKHIRDIASKYIIPSETSDGAVMFIPAEVIFAEIHARYPELINLAHRLHVWVVSPNTMMAVLTTARAVLHDITTKEQAHVVQKQLLKLSEDFKRFQTRMSKLASHVDLAHRDVEDVQKSSHKIVQSFRNIEKVEFASDSSSQLVDKARELQDQTSSL